MEIGISIMGNADYKKDIAGLEAAGVKRTFVMSESPYLSEIMAEFSQKGIICETLHAPYNKINDMWSADDTAGEAMLNRLLDCADKCAKYNIPTMIVHISSGRPMPEITEAGNLRYKRLIDYAKKKNIKIAFENLRYRENLEYSLSRYPESVFCWDCGHEYCFTPGQKFVPLFGDRLGALHIHDNYCHVDSDDHLLPFDGSIDFNIVAKELAQSGYKGTLMLEVFRDLTPTEKIYDTMSTEEFFKRAASAARKLADMVENYRK